MFKKDRFSIRKIKGVVGSVFLGSLLMAPSVVDAATYHYVNKEIISQEAKDLIQTGKPDRNEVVYGLVYQKDQLPQTGTEASVLTAFGLLTVGSLLLIYKRKKIASVFLVGAMGLVVLPSAGAVDPVATLALASREGVVEMDGYRYVGYLSGDILKTLGLDTVLEETSAKPGEVTVVEVETPQSTTNQEQARTENQVVETEEAPKTEESPKEEPKSEIKPTDDTLPKVEEGKEASAEPATVEEVGGEVESKPEEKVAVKPESQPSDKPAEESKVEQAGEPVAPREDEKAPVEPEKQPEAPEEEKAVEETPKQEESTPDTKAEETVEPKEETVNQSIEQPKVETPAVEKQTEPTEEPKVEQAGEPVAPREDEQAPTAPVEPEKQPEVPEEEKAVEETPKPEDKIKGIGTKEPVDKSELNNQIDKASSVSPTDYSTASYNALGPVLETAKGVYASEPVKQPEVNSETNKLKTAIDALNVDKTELNNTIADAKTKVKEHYSDRSWQNLQTEVTKAEKVAANTDAKQSEVNEAVEKLTATIEKLVELSEKPILTLTSTDKKILEREAVAKYTLENQNKTKIKSITAELKKGEEVINTVVLTDDKVTTETISAAFKNLEYYKEYTLSTTMIYDRGNGEETETLENQNIQLDLKKVELKNIKRTDLIKYENGKETNESLITTIPDDKSNYYLKITSNNQKTTLLAVKNIEETTVNGTPVYKVTAIADNLVSRTADNKFEEEYVHYIEKPKVHEDNVYYNFKELVEAIQNDPSKEYRLGQSMSARNVVPNGKSYITKEFTGKLLSSEGKQFAITELEHPLFNVITNATINNVNFENVEIERSGQDNIASLANTMKGSSVITNVKITGTLSGRNNVAGFVNNMNDGTRIENVAFFGKLHSTSGNGSHTGGIAGTNYRGIVRKAYVDATITGNKTRASLLVPKVDYGLTLDHLIGTKALLTESVVKGKIDVSNPVEVGAIASKTWPVGTVSNSVSYAKIIRGEELFGSNDVDDSDYASAHIKDLYAVEGYSSGNRSFRKSKTFTKLTKEQADAKVTTFNITADKLESDLSPLAKLNEEKAYSSIQDYNAEYNQAYKNLEKLIPFYNKDYIVYQGNKLNKEHHLNTKEVLSVTAMNNNEFITNLDEANKIIVHYADGTKDYFNLSSSSEGLSNVKEYTITDLGIKYTPNIVQKDNTTLVNDIKSILESVELQSQTMYQHLNRLGDYRVNAIKDLYLEESFTDVKENLTNLITKLVQNEEHQLNDSPAARQMIRDKVEKNKAALLLGLTYLNRYYGVKFGDVNIKELMLFKPDFYGEKVSVLDRLIEIGSKENNIKGSRTFDAFGQVLAKYTKSGNLDAFLNYNRQLFTNIDNMNDWFIDATEDHVYIAERASEVEEIKNSKHRAFDNLKRSHLRNTILPLLNIDKAHLYLISNYNAIAFGSAERLGKKSLEDIKDIVNKAADGYRNYYDFWYRLASDNVKQRLLRDAVIPIWEGYNAPGGWVEKYGRYNTDKVYTPLREFFGPMDKYYNYNGTGAYAAIYPNSDDIRTDVKYVHLEMVGEYGISVYTHETTHVNDRAIYLGGFGHREGTDAEAYAQGMLQTPVTGSGFDEFGSLGINMVFKRKNDGNQWYITDPKTLKTREDINRYMKGYNDTLTLLDEIEAESVISQQNKDLNSAWFKKIDREYRDNNKLNQWDKIRNLSQEEKNELNIQSVNDLVDQQLMTNRNPGNGIYKPEAISYNDQSPYVGVRMMTGIYGGNTSKGAPGAVSFKHNAFRLWGYYGYENGFLGYASNKYKQQSKTDGESVLSDEYIIKKISNNTFNTIEEFKKAYFKEVKDKATKGLTTFEVNGSSVSSYDDLLTLFKEAVKKDAETLKQEANGNKTVSMNNTVKLKEAVYKKLLQQTNSFKTSIFK
ncbi:TPA: ZmpA/ZmpB/ZmpC family metallo-endopeptidase [Streptococcus pneumoniae]|uniref:Zinc metalloprotease ZmpB n=1 Tax=Streptococcus pneumoniae TaxID=1313 RepID=A0A4J1MQD2_STREE|nr:ZmpA/ZmpB/ZmpC family metallo-endopeptidase [Streptococcus pneumoniae]KXW35254.1 zinc metalloprotease [Streptococcus pneumoniae]MBW5124243.1 LPXTG cell wall anchor domain-containing protein [Streptococcus pneumoniae]MBW5195593.1 LPXTG cell wall anchor domain-containing protein [Streptococcus pneumoniae]MBW8140971.1 LPXTG cell wall anchor domain-containing protein [Streptococcus pneumoniae]MBW8149001.1 LPXTG cell wall anchor domain-containing protein [Streptococcus pneumoniae]